MTDADISTLLQAAAGSRALHNQPACCSAHLGGADGVEEDGAGARQDHVAKVGPGKAAAPQDEAHKEGWVPHDWSAQLPAHPVCMSGR